MHTVCCCRAPQVESCCYLKSTITCVFDEQCLVSLCASEKAALPVSRLAAAYEDLAVGPHQKSFNELEEEVKTEERNCACHHRPPTPGNRQNSVPDVSLESDSSSSVDPSTSTTEPPAKTDGSPQTDPGLLTKTVTVSLKRRLFSVAQLVVEPDSQSSSPSIGPSQEEETEVGAERLQESEEPSQKDLHSPVKIIEIAKPIRKHRRKARKFSSR